VFLGANFKLLNTDKKARKGKGPPGPKADVPRGGLVKKILYL